MRASGRRGRRTARLAATMSDSDDDVVFIPNPTGKAQLPHSRAAPARRISFVAPPGGQLSITAPRRTRRSAPPASATSATSRRKSVRAGDVHCDATDKGPNAAYWKIRRNEVKKGRRAGAAAATNDRAAEAAGLSVVRPTSRTSSRRSATRAPAGLQLQAFLPGHGLLQGLPPALPPRGPGRAPSAERKDATASRPSPPTTARGALRRDPRRVLPVERDWQRPLPDQRRLRQRARRAARRGPQGRDPQGRARDTRRRDAHQPRCNCVEAGVDGVGAQGLQARQALTPSGPSRTLRSIPTRAEAARAADVDGAPGQAWPTKAPPAAHITYRSTYCECCGFSYQGPQWEWDRTSHAKVLACDVCGSAMRGPVVESRAGKVVEGPAAGKAVLERAAQVAS